MARAFVNRDGQVVGRIRTIDRISEGAPGRRVEGFADRNRVTKGETMRRTAMTRRARLLGIVGVVTACVVTALPAARAADDASIRAVPVPTVEGPIPANAGPRGGPWGFIFEPLALSPHNYVEEEFFISGTAKAYGTE